MKVIDIKKYCNEYFEMVGYVDSKVIFCKEGRDKQDNLLREFFEYNIKLDKLRKINNTNIKTEDWYNDDIFFTTEYIYASISDSMTCQILYRICMTSGITEKLLELHKDAKYDYQTIILNKDFLIQFVSSDPMRNLSDQSVMNEAYFIDIKNNMKYKIGDKRIVLGVRKNIIIYEINNIEYIMIEEVYEEDYEKEDYFLKNIKREDFEGESYRNSLLIINLQDFINEAKQGKELLSFEEIETTELNGWVRYLGMDKMNIYYRVKNFNKQMEHIISFNKFTFHKKTIFEFLYPQNNSIISYQFSHQDNNAIIHQIIINNNNIKVKGVLNSSIEVEYNKSDSGSFYGIVDDRYLCTSYWKEDEEGDEINYALVKDLDSKTISKYEGYLELINGVAIIYN